MSEDFPNGIEGSSNGSARFMTVDENLKIYRDSSTRIMTGSLENEMSFESLGLDGSLGVSTCNGCKAPESHRLFAGTDYINFKAHMDLDVFLMYDTRAGGKGTIPPNLVSKGIQSVTLPAGAPPEANQKQISEIEAPPVINDTWIPIGDVYDLGPKDSKIEFGAGNFAKIQYKYDSARLAANGLPEEFNVMYFEDGVWKPADKVTVDYSKKIITAYTSHFTPFVPVVVLPTAGFTTPAPSCISADFPSGIAGNTAGSAEFMIVDENFKYYKDRNYTIKPFASSPDNAATFAALGFDGAMGIATCNGGGTNGCGSQENNKLYDGSNYINFTAHQNLDMYLVYETRGGGGKNLNTTNDAPWIAAKGFI